MRRTNPTADTGNLSPMLRILLNDAAEIALDAKDAHWNVKGPSFRGLHKLFDDIHAAADEYADLIAERLAQFGQKAVARPEESKLRATADAQSGASYVVSLAAELAIFSGRLSEAATAADEAGDAATLDILSEILRGSDKWRWMLESHDEVKGAVFNPMSQDELRGRARKFRGEPGLAETHRLELKYKVPKLGAWPQTHWVGAFRNVVDRNSALLRNDDIKVVFRKLGRDRDFSMLNDWELDLVEKVIAEGREQLWDWSDKDYELAFKEIDALRSDAKTNPDYSVAFKRSPGPGQLHWVDVRDVSGPAEASRKASGRAPKGWREYGISRTPDDTGRANPQAEVEGLMACRGCGAPMPKGYMAWLSDHFGGWFCTKSCDMQARRRQRSKAAGRASGHDVRHARPGRVANPRRNADDALRAAERAHRTTGSSGTAEALASALRRAGRGDEAEVVLATTSGDASPDVLLMAIKGWWKSKEADWGDLSYGVRFWTPEEWRAKGERFGNSAPLNMTSEGGFNRILSSPENREDDALVEEWNRLIESLGWRWETNTNWAFSFYRAR